MGKLALFVKLIVKYLLLWKAEIMQRFEIFMGDIVVQNAVNVACVVE